MVGEEAERLRGYDFYRRVLRSPRWVLAPMVEHSELPYRVMARRLKADLCYTPMLNARLVVENAGYLGRHLEAQSGNPLIDRPLIVQLCGHDPQILLQAARLVEHRCDAVDVNLGCPQSIAKRGHYGAFLMDDLALVERIVRTLDQGLRVPVTCKIRIFPTVEQTVAYARMLERAGCSLLVVHGRLREQKGPLTGLADLDAIRAVKQSVAIPVIANGNVVVHQDLQSCLQYTGCDGVMSAEGHLYNPFLFASDKIPSMREAIQLYLDMVRQYPPCSDVPVKGHLFKLARCALDGATYRHALIDVNDDADGGADADEAGLEELHGRLGDFRQRIGTCSSVDALLQVAEELCATIPAHWACRPYYRHSKTCGSQGIVQKGPQCVIQDRIEDMAQDMIRDIVQERIQEVSKTMNDDASPWIPQDVPSI